MVKIVNGQTIIEFGEGDICVTGGDTLQSDIGIVTFKNQNKREIGSSGVIKANIEFDLNQVDVLINFHKVESIDVVINALQEAKKYMKTKED